MPQFRDGVRFGGLFRCYGSSTAAAARSTRNTRIDRVLVANRGEIAVRIMKTAHRMGIETVAVYSDPDRQSMHTRNATLAYRIGPAPPLESYLNGDRLIDTALKSRAQAIHPGYGFLSENAVFARKCENAGLIFVGPPPRAISDMGAKNLAKQIMANARVPIVDGYFGDVQSNDVLRQQAASIGYPIMIKAVHGGGGKGMRIAWNDAEFDEKLESARSESRKSFGDDGVILEKFIQNPRHVEVQIFGDHYDEYVYLWERDCSIQRRHQKIIEEAPAPGLDTEIRRELGESAVKAAQAVGYVGAGTVEFIMDSNRQFFFMEMNTRLQVEHPVTEAITGTDLVEWQFRIAQFEKLPLSQEEIPLNGHAIEARIYAEDTHEGFIPQAGRLKHLRFPDFARVDTGVREGDDVSVHYDPMIAKVIVWAEDRERAITKLSEALRETHIGGISTNVSFVRNVLGHPKFMEGNVYTEFIADNEKDLFRGDHPLEADICEAIIGQMLLRQRSPSPQDPFGFNDYFRMNSTAKRSVEIDNKAYLVEILDEKTVRIRIDGHTTTNIEVDAVERSPNCVRFTLTFDGQQLRRKAFEADAKITIFGDSHKEYMESKVSVADEVIADGDTIADGCAPMPGLIEKIHVADGDIVKAGQALIVMVAMKMEYIIRAPCDAVVKAVQCNVGANVPKNAHLIKFEHI